jgi:hypothetical protein
MAGGQASTMSNAPIVFFIINSPLPHFAGTMAAGFAR